MDALSLSAVTVKLSLYGSITDPFVQEYTIRVVFFHCFLEMVFCAQAGAPVSSITMQSAGIKADDSLIIRVRVRELWIGVFMLNFQRSTFNYYCYWSVVDELHLHVGTELACADGLAEGFFCFAHKVLVQRDGDVMPRRVDVGGSVALLR